MGKAFNYERAEQEANKIGLEFANSNDVVKDMSRAYNVDFSNIKVHTDSAADNKVKAAGKDALAQGNDIFFGKGIFESSDPADKGLVAHEFAHTMQQGAAMGGEMAVAESAPMGMAQGGLGSWFRKHFGKKKTYEDPKQLERDMEVDLDALSTSYAEDDRTTGVNNAIYDLDAGSVIGPYATYAKHRAKAPKFQDKTYTDFDKLYPKGYNLAWSDDMVNTASDLMTLMGATLKKSGEEYDLDEILDGEIKTMNEEIKYDSSIDQEKYYHFLDSGRLLSHMLAVGKMEESDREELPEQIKSLYKQYEVLRESLEG